MSALNKLKKILVFPLTRTAPTVSVGSLDKWDIVHPGNAPLFVIAAGVGKHVTFELDLAKRWTSQIVLLDPTPTGIETMAQIEGVDGLEYLPLGLSVADGKMLFAKPECPEEGSFSLSEETDGDTVSFECRSLETLLEIYGRDAIDILKLDIEGFEYAVLDRMLAQNIPVHQICVEIHTRNGSGAPFGIVDAVLLILRLYRAGYRIVFNKAMDFTFCHTTLLNHSYRKVG